MDKYQKELTKLKPHDETQGMEEDKKGYKFITTAGHGYLVVPKNDKYYKIALRICKYGYIGELACYLEEDCEVAEFYQSI